MAIDLSPRDPGTERLAYSPQEVADLLGCHRSKVYQLLAEGQLRGVKLGARNCGGRTLILRDELLRFLAELPDYESASTR